IADLTSNQLRLLDNGRTQAIRTFARLEKGASSPIVLLYDLLNIGIYSRATVQEQIVQALKNLPPNAPAFLYILSGDAELHAIHGVGSTEGSSRPKGADSLMDSALHNTSVVRQSHLSQIGARVNATYTALIHLANEVAALKGR